MAKHLPRVQIVCEYCHNSFTTFASRVNTKKYCSKQCYSLAMLKQVERVCEGCGVIFSVCVSTLKYNPSKYCSQRCYHESKVGNSVQCQCKHCGKSFEVDPLQYIKGMGKYCSNACREASRAADRVELECICGKRFITTRRKAENGKRFCSKACAGKFYEKRVTLICEQCGEPFQLPPSHAQGRRFCSTECRGKFNVTSITRDCEWCGKEFQAVFSIVQKGGGKFCSNLCASRARNPVEKIKTNCLYCGKEFDLYPSEMTKGRGKYCSKECYNKDHSRIVICKTCSKPFVAESKRRKYCSRECSGIAMTGEKHHNWRGGLFYSFGLNWKRQRKLAYERDGGRCQHCGLTEKQALEKFHRKNDIHHIIKRRTLRDQGKFKEVNNLQNLITLCQKCHRAAENSRIHLQPRLL